MKLTLKQKQLVKEYARKLFENRLNEGSDIDADIMNSFIQAAGINLSKIDKQNKNWTVVKTDITIPIEKLHPLLQPAFQSITLNKVAVGYASDGLVGWWLLIDYSWKHWTGSNGLHLRLFSKDGVIWQA